MSLRKNFFQCAEFNPPFGRGLHIRSFNLLPYPVFTDGAWPADLQSASCQG